MKIDTRERASEKSAYVRLKIVRQSRNYRRGRHDVCSLFDLKRDERAPKTLYAEKRQRSKEGARDKRAGSCSADALMSQNNNLLSV